MNKGIYNALINPRWVKESLENCCIELLSNIARNLRESLVLIVDNVNGGVRYTPSLEVLVYDTWYSERPKNTRNESGCTVHSEPDVQRKVFPGVNQKKVRLAGSHRKLFVPQRI